MTRTENLALAYQEIFTVIARVRSNRQVARNADVFRANMRGVLKKAEQDALANGYSPEDARLATFAVVAFLDESLLASADAVFGDWKRMPLQQEMFKTGNAGEEFFRGLELLMKRPDSPSLADLLEVYHLCLLLGFRGRYGGTESLRSVKEAVGERIRRLRGPAPPLCTTAAPTGGSPLMVRPDPWVKRFAVAAIASLALAIVLLAGFKFSLGSGIRDIAALGAGGGH